MAVTHDARWMFERVRNLFKIDLMCRFVNVSDILIDTHPTTVWWNILYKINTTMLTVYHYLIIHQSMNTYFPNSCHISIQFLICRITFRNHYDDFGSCCVLRGLYAGLHWLLQGWTQSTCRRYSRQLLHPCVCLRARHHYAHSTIEQLFVLDLLAKY